MTQLVSILGGGKICLRLVVQAIICCTIYLCFVSVASAQLSFPGQPSAPDPTPGTNPDLNFPTNPNSNNPNVEVGRGEAGPGGPITAEEREQAAANAMVSENMGALDDPVLQFLHKYILTGIGSFVAYTGKAFDYAIEEYIIGFGNLYINKNVGVAIDSMWSTVRDIFNLTFIFGLVYIGFKMILDSSDSSARKMLISLIGAALLVNFSLFITKFVVDFSNIAAAQIYEAFGNTDLPNFSITNGFMTMMGINDLVGVEMTASAGYAYIVGMLLVFAILIYVFLAGAIMIIIRFVVLCIYMVFSPIMFLGWVFPAMKGHSQKYWSGFLSQAFFAPAFIFMLYLSYRVTYTFSYTTKNWGHFFGQGIAKPIGVDGLIPFFAMVIIFLLASIMVAKNMGAVGASTAISVGNKIRGSAQGIMYRNTGGRLAKGALNVMDRSGISNLPGTRSLRSAIKSGYEYGAGGTSLAKTRSEIKAENAEINQNRVRMNSDESSARRATNFRAQTAALQNNTLGTQQLNDAMNGLATTIREMSDDERGELSIGQLTNNHVAANLTDAHLSSLEKTGKFSIDEINLMRASRRQSQVNVAQHGFATVSTVGGVIGASNTAVRGAAAAHQVAQRQRLLAGGDAVVGNMPVDALLAPGMLPYITPRIVEARMRNGLNEADRIRLRNAIQGGVTTPAMMAPWAQWQGQGTYGSEFFR